MNGWAIDVYVVYEGTYTEYFDTTEQVVDYLEKRKDDTYIQLTVRPLCKEYEGWEFLELYKEGKIL